MTLQIRAIPRQGKIAGDGFAPVPWHYKSGQSPDLNLSWIIPMIKIRTMTLQIRAIPRPRSSPWRKLFCEYHDITNPGNPQTYSWTFSIFTLCTMTLQIRAIPRPNSFIVTATSSGTMTLQIRAIPRHFPEDIEIPEYVPWHYKSGQSPDQIGLEMRLFCSVPWHYKSGQSPDHTSFSTPLLISTMTLQIRAIPRLVWLFPALP